VLAGDRRGLEEMGLALVTLPRLTFLSACLC
jgi:hypothetical protein